MIMLLGSAEAISSRASCSPLTAFGSAPCGAADEGLNRLEKLGAYLGGPIAEVAGRQPRQAVERCGLGVLEEGIAVAVGGDSDLRLKGQAFRPKVGGDDEGP